jgi:hypothetical protein
MPSFLFFSNIIDGFPKQFLSFSRNACREAGAELRPAPAASAYFHQIEQIAFLKQYLYRVC